VQADSASPFEGVVPTVGTCAQPAQVSQVIPFPACCLDFFAAARLTDWAPMISMISSALSADIADLKMSMIALRELVGISIPDRIASIVAFGNFIGTRIGGNVFGPWLSFPEVFCVADLLFAGDLSSRPTGATGAAVSIGVSSWLIGSGANCDDMISLIG
jgi:hypothetical protein